MMAPRRLTPGFLALQRAQLDNILLQYKSLRDIPPPRRGWINAIRTALGMTASQLGKRLGMTSQGVQDLERREAAGTITIGSLRRAADAVNCDVVVALIPRQSIEEMVRAQARLRAGAARDRVVHTMRLEAQDEGVAATLDQHESADSWITRRIRRLWD